MSIQANAGSSAAAEYIMKFILNLIEEMDLETDYGAHRVAMEIYKHAEEIKKSADSGQY